MRRLVQVALAGLVGLALLGIGTRPAGAATEIVFLAWGGLYHDIFRPVADDFEKETGIKVTFAVQSGAKDGLNKLTAQRHNPQVDVWASIESTAKAAAEAGLLSDLTVARIPNLGAIPKTYVTPTAVAIWLSPRGIFYRKDLVPFEIKKWEDLWDPRLEGKVGTSFVLDTGNFLVMSALINGGSERNIDPGFAKAKALKPNLGLFYKTDPESIKFLEAGEISVAGWGVLPNVYRHLGPGSKYRFVMPEKPQFLAVIPVSIVKGRGAEREAAAEKFVNYLLSKGAQEKLVAVAGTIPANPNARPPATIKDMIPPLDNVYQVDWSLVNANYSRWEDRWNREIQSR